MPTPTSRYPFAGHKLQQVQLFHGRLQQERGNEHVGLERHRVARARHNRHPLGGHVQGARRAHARAQHAREGPHLGQGRGRRRHPVRGVARQQCARVAPRVGMAAGQPQVGVVRPGHLRPAGVHGPQAVLLDEPLARVGAHARLGLRRAGDRLLARHLRVDVLPPTRRRRGDDGGRPAPRALRGLPDARAPLQVHLLCLRRPVQAQRHGRGHRRARGVARGAQRPGNGALSLDGQSGQQLRGHGQRGQGPAVPPLHQHVRRAPRRVGRALCDRGAVHRLLQACARGGLPLCGKAGRGKALPSCGKRGQARGVHAGVRNGLRPPHELCDHGVH